MWRYREYGRRVGWLGIFVVFPFLVDRADLGFQTVLIRSVLLDRNHC